MRRFVELYEEIDRTTSTNAKVEAMRRYFEEAPAEDAAWGAFFLSGRTLKRLVSYADLRGWAREESGLAPWLFEETHATVGDLGETIALVLAPSEGATEDAGLATWVESRLLPLRPLDKLEQRREITGWWRRFDRATVFVLNKMLTGALRVGVSKTLVVRALAARFELDKDVVARRMQGAFEPTASWLASVGEPAGDVGARPVPFFLASPIEGDAGAIEAQLGDRDAWLVEHKWDGIRAQAVRSGADTVLWSRGEEPVGEAFPELVGALSRLPDGTILEGEILAHDASGPLPFAVLQKRLGRKSVGPRTTARYPAVFMAYDLLADAGGDRTTDPIETRRADLEAMIGSVFPGGPAHAKVLLSPIVEGATWAALEAERDMARERRVEGLMLKRHGSPYRVGRVKGDWWKWKIEAYTLDLVLTYAQPGRGRRANLLTDYTFGVWEDEPGGELVTLTKAYSGLDQDEIARLDRWIRRHTIERFGPVRRVQASQVFELAFEGVHWSDRHASGIALRFPRIARWRTDLSIMEADTLESVRSMIDEPAPDQGFLPGLGPA